MKSRLLPCFLACVYLACYIFASPSISIAAPTMAKPTTTKISSAQRRSRELNEEAAALAKAGQVKKAEKLLREATKLDSRNITSVFNLGSILIEQGKMDEAIPLLENYIRKFPDDAGLHARLGDAYFAKKQIEKASRSYEKALSIDPNYPLVSARLGTIYAMSQKINLAIDKYLTAVTQEPHNQDYLMNLSNLYLANGESQKAISTAKRGLQVKPSSAFYVTLGSAYEQKKEWKNSLIAYQRAKDLGSKDKNLDDKIELMERHIK